jgi:hypothetical protein
MYSRCIWLLIWICSAHNPALAGTFFTDFESTPPGTAVYGNAIINPGGGVDDSGVLKLTPVERDRIGTFIVDNIDGGKAVAGFRITFKLQISGGGKIGADGISVSVGPKLPQLINEGGITHDFALMFDTFVENGTAPPEIYVFHKGRDIAKYQVPGMRTPNRFVDVDIQVDTHGILNLVFNSERFIKDFVLPNFKPIRAAQFGFGARTGGSSDNHLIDDLSIVTAVSGQTLPAHTARPTPRAGAAERVWFVNDGEVLQGCVYKPVGDGPFPAIILAEGNSTPLPDEGTVNPCPEVAGLFLEKGYALFLPGSFDLESERNAIQAKNEPDLEHQLITLHQRQAKRLEAALQWLQVQSFVDRQRIVVIGDGPGGVDALLAFTPDDGIRGLALFCLGDKMEAGDPLRRRISGAISTAKFPMTLFYRQPASSQPIVETFLTGLKSWGADCHIVDSGNDSANNALLPRPELWADELFNFFAEVNK